jgi:hypothetical protein
MVALQLPAERQEPCVHGFGVLVRPQQASGFKTHNSSHHLHAIASLLTQLASAKLQQSHYAFGKVLEELQS